MLIEREDNQIKHNVINIEIAKALRGKKKKKKNDSHLHGKVSGKCKTDVKVLW